ncbi:MAG: hypothetical protein Q4B42_06535 [Oscillospiraceae bacterium]|nr:hypothetical protein [Oscillospiraceae bacterium]
MFEREKKTLSPLKKLLLLVLAAALVCCLFLLARRVSRDLSEQSAEALKLAVIRSAAQCYAVEGVYPSSLGYLEEHYGLVVNHERYIVAYEAFSSNLPPDVEVLEKGAEGR